MEITYHLSQFDGPLDMLLFMLDKAKIDIRDIFISDDDSTFIIPKAGIGIDQISLLILIGFRYLIFDRTYDFSDNLFLHGRFCNHGLVICRRIVQRPLGFIETVWIFVIRIERADRLCFRIHHFGESFG